MESRPILHSAQGQFYHYIQMAHCLPANMQKKNDLRKKTWWFSCVPIINSQSRKKGRCETYGHVSAKTFVHSPGSDCAKSHGRSKQTRFEDTVSELTASVSRLHVRVTNPWDLPHIRQRLRNFRSWKKSPRSKHVETSDNLEFRNFTSTPRPWRNVSISRTQFLFYDSNIALITQYLFYDTNIALYHHAASCAWFEENEHHCLRIETRCSRDKSEAQPTKNEEFPLLKKPSRHVETSDTWNFAGSYVC